MTSSTLKIHSRQAQNEKEIIMQKSLREYVEKEEAFHTSLTYKAKRKECYKEGQYMTIYTDIPSYPRGHYKSCKLFYIVFDYFDFDQNEIVGKKVETRDNKSFEHCDFKKDVWAVQPFRINFLHVDKLYGCLFLGPDM